MGELVPSYPQPYRLFNPLSGHPLYSGPNGQPGYGTAQPQADSWVQPDGVRVWFYDTSTPDQTNQTALGLIEIWDGAPSIGYAGAYAAAQRHGANADQADLFAAISMAESSAHWGAHNNNSRTGDDSIGLWQINLRAHPQYRATNLYNIDANAQAAAEVSNAWTNPHPWSTYLSGAYKTYLHGSGAPVGGITGGTPPPPSNAGVFRRAVDSLIGNIPSIPLVGGAIRDGVRAVLDPVADLIDSWIDILAKDIQGAITYSETLVGDAEDLAKTLVQGAETLADQGLHALASFTATLITDAENLTRTLVGEAESVASAGLHDLAAFTGTLIRDAENLTRTLVGDAERLAETGLHDLAAFTGTLIREAEDVAAAGVREAEHLAEVGLHDLEGATAALINEAERIAEAAARDLVAVAEGELHTLEHDVIDPLADLVHHWFDDVLHGAEAIFPALVTLEAWIVGAAKLAVLGPLDLAETIADISSDDVIGAVRSAYKL